MNFLNVTNIHDCAEAHFRVGLKKATIFDVTNDGSAIKIEDKANTVTKLKVGGSAGFTISYSGGKIIFSANSGASPLRIIEPNVGGVPDCPYLFTHQDKYSGAAGNSLDINNSSTPVVFSAENTDITKIHASTKIPKATEVEDGSLLMAKDGEWVSIEMGDLVSQITANVRAELGL